MFGNISVRQKVERIVSIVDANDDACLRVDEIQVLVGAISGVPPRAVPPNHAEVSSYP